MLPPRLLPAVQLALPAALLLSLAGIWLCLREECGAVGAAASVSGGTRDDGYADMDAACRQMVGWLRRQIDPDGQVVLHPPFVIGGDFPSDELDQHYRKTIAPATRAIAAGYLARMPDKPITILLARTGDSYRQFAQRLFGEQPASSFGYYRRHLRIILVNAGRGDGGLLHELTHALVADDFPAIPQWLDEGLASLHETSGLLDGVLVGKDNWRLPILCEAIERGQLRSLESLVASGGFQRQPPGLSYAQARYFCLFLQERGILEDLYRRLRQEPEARQSSGSAVTGILGRQDWQELDQEFRQWVLQRQATTPWAAEVPADARHE